MKNKTRRHIVIRKNDGTVDFKPRICIIILNWNGWNNTVECLESIFRIDYPKYTVVIVDNGSHDGSMSFLKMWADCKLDVWTVPDNPLRNLSNPPIRKPIQYVEYNFNQSCFELVSSGGHGSHPRLVLIQTGTNLGYAGGNNVGIRYALGNNFSHVVLLNNDTVVEGCFLRYLVETTTASDNIGITGGKVCFYKYPGVIQSVGSKIELLKGKLPPIGFGQKDIGQFAEKTIADYVTGALMLVRAEVFEKIGLFDEDFFLYSEEVDFCHRASSAGYIIIVEPRAKIWHKIAASSGGSYSETYLYYSFRNKIFFLKKHFPRRYYFLIWPIIFRWLIACATCMKKGYFTGIKSSTRGIIHGIFG